MAWSRPNPTNGPGASFTRFEADLPNELWQTDATEWLLADFTKVEILNLIDDHSRLCLASVAVRTVKAADAVQTFYSDGQVTADQAKTDARQNVDQPLMSPTPPQSVRPFSIAVSLDTVFVDTITVGVSSTADSVGKRPGACSRPTGRNALPPRRP